MRDGEREEGGGERVMIRVTNYVWSSFTWTKHPITWIVRLCTDNVICNITLVGYITKTVTINLK